MAKFKSDEIGPWSEIKLEIIEKYAAAYTKILSGQTHVRLKYEYIDGFCGAGEHIYKKTKQPIEGSPVRALKVDPPFHHYHFIDLDGQKTAYLQETTKGRSNVTVHTGDCNELLKTRILPGLTFQNYRRGLCILDPYGLDLNWEIIEITGKSRAIDLFLNFPVMDMNRNALWHNQSKVSAENIARMNAFWGDDSWRSVAYVQVPTLFGFEDEKADNETIAKAFAERLKKQATFKHVEYIPMKNSSNAVVYYLFFASHKPVAKNIVEDIFSKYR
jgi:three-Cys-motif partner protein